MDHQVIVNNLQENKSIMPLVGVGIATFHVRNTCTFGCAIRASLTAQVPFITPIPLEHCPRCIPTFQTAMPPTNTFLQRYALIPTLPKCMAHYSCLCCYRSRGKAMAVDGACAVCIGRHEMETEQVLYSILICREQTNRDTAAIIVQYLLELL
jgi:hypothetical protein